MTSPEPLFIFNLGIVGASYEDCPQINANGSQFVVHLVAMTEYEYLGGEIIFI